MAAKVANGSQGSNEREQGPGVSYASILNPKSSNETRAVNKGNNKENIGDQVVQQQVVPVKDRIASQSLTVKGKPDQRTERRFSPQNKLEKRYGNEVTHETEQRQLGVQKEVQIEHRQVARFEKEQINGDIGSDGEFQTVAPKSARRKEKLREHQRDVREWHRHRDYRHPLRGHTRSNERLYKDRERADKSGLDHVTGNKDVVKDKDEFEADSEVHPVPPVKYVEAPLPTVNPWTKSKIMAAAAPMQNSVTAVSSSVVISAGKQIVKEKHVLQPQQQQQQQQQPHAHPHPQSQQQPQQQPHPQSQPQPHPQSQPQPQPQSRSHPQLYPHPHPQSQPQLQPQLQLQQQQQQQQQQPVIVGK